MNDTQLREWYAAGLAARQGGPRTECPSPADLHAVLERKDSEEERLNRLDHIMACPECLREFELLRTLHSAAPRRRYSGRVLLLAASVALVASATVVWRATSATPDAVDTLRGQTVSLLLEPIDGATASFPVTLAWRKVEGALRYRFEFIDEGGEVVLSRETVDTAVTMVADPSLVQGEEYRWWVVADRRGGRQVRSTPRRIRFEPQ